MTSETTPKAYYGTWDIKVRELEVLRRTYITPRMVRVTLGGPGIEGFESHLPDEHMKLVFPDPDTEVTRAPTQDGDHLDWPSPFPPTREYTVRRFDRRSGELDIDFVVHPGGLASEWAQLAAIGSTLWVAGPRPSLVVPPEFGFLVLLGDFTHSIELPIDTHTYVFASGEAGCIKPVRRWAREHGIGKEQSDIGGYWKRGRTNAVPVSARARVAAEARHAFDHLLGRKH